MNFHSITQKNLFESYIAPPPISRCYTTKASAFTNLPGNPLYLGNMRHFTKKTAPFGPGHLKTPPLEHRTDFCDPLVKIVGGFVGSKSQAGTTSHRGREFSLWDVIMDKIIDTMENPELRQQAPDRRGRPADSGKKNGKIHQVESFTMFEVGQYPDCATGVNFVDKIIQNLGNPEPPRQPTHQSRQARKNGKIQKVESFTMIGVGQYGPECPTGPNFGWYPPGPEFVGSFYVQNEFPELGVFQNLSPKHAETGPSLNCDREAEEFICKTEFGTCKVVERHVNNEDRGCQDEPSLPMPEEMASSRISGTPSDCSPRPDDSGESKGCPLTCRFERVSQFPETAQPGRNCPESSPEPVSSCAGTAPKHILRPEAAEFTPRISRPSFQSESEDDSNPVDVSSSDLLSSSCESRSPSDDTFRRPKVHRSLSECSVDSDDSFIVFESAEDDPVIISEDSDCEDCFSDEDLDEIDNPILFPHNLDFSQPPPVLSRLEEANKKWAESYADVNLEASDSATKKVKFAEGNNLVKVKHLVAWDFAHRAARIGPWEMYLRDSERFKSRISSLSAILSPVLAKRHREKIYSERFQT